MFRLLNLLALAGVVTGLAYIGRPAPPREALAYGLSTGEARQGADEPHRHLRHWPRS